MTLDRAALDELARIGTATLSTQLVKRGIRRHRIRGAAPLLPDRRIAGPAFTLRFLPAREDLPLALGERPADRHRVGSAVVFPRGPALEVRHDGTEVAPALVDRSHRFDELVNAGVDILRLSPQSRHGARVVATFRALLDGAWTPAQAQDRLLRLMPAAPCDGYWLGEAGMAWMATPAPPEEVTMRSVCTTGAATGAVSEEPPPLAQAAVKETRTAGNKRRIGDPGRRRIRNVTPV